MPKKPVGNDVTPDCDNKQESLLLANKLLFGQVGRSSPRRVLPVFHSHSTL